MLRMARRSRSGSSVAFHDQNGAPRYSAGGSAQAPSNDFGDVMGWSLSLCGLRGLFSNPPRGRRKRKPPGRTLKTAVTVPNGVVEAGIEGPPCRSDGYPAVRPVARLRCPSGCRRFESLPAEAKESAEKPSPSPLPGSDSRQKIGPSRQPFMGLQTADSRCAHAGQSARLRKRKHDTQLARSRAGEIFREQPSGSPTEDWRPGRRPARRRGRGRRCPAGASARRCAAPAPAT